MQTSHAWLALPDICQGTFPPPLNYAAPTYATRPLVWLRCVGILICGHPKVWAENSASSSSDTV
jgi:hypothetical protein